MRDTLNVPAASDDDVDDALSVEYEAINVASRHVGSSHAFEPLTVLLLGFEHGDRHPR